MFKGITGSLKDQNAHAINAVPSNNIERFDCYAGLVLGNLYRNFPMPLTVTAEQFIDYPAGRLNDREALEKEENVFLATLKWLADVGYIHFDGMSGVSFFEVVLTSNGLLILRALPEGADTAPTLGEKLALCVKDEHAADLSALVTEVLSLGSRALSPMTRSGI